MGCCGTISTNSYVTETTRNFNNDTSSSNSNNENEKYIYIDKIDNKGFSGKSIKVISDKTNIYYIIKIIEEKKKFKNAILEAQLLEICKHPNIVNIKQIYKEIDDDNISVNIVTEYANDGDLFKKLEENKCIDEETLLFWLIWIDFLRYNNLMYLYLIYYISKEF